MLNFCLTRTEIGGQREEASFILFQIGRSDCALFLFLSSTSRSRLKVEEKGSKKCCFVAAFLVNHNHMQGPIYPVLAQTIACPLIRSHLLTLSLSLSVPSTSSTTSALLSRLPSPSDTSRNRIVPRCHTGYKALNGPDPSPVHKPFHPHSSQDGRYRSRQLASRPALGSHPLSHLSHPCWLLQPHLYPFWICERPDIMVLYPPAAAGNAAVGVFCTRHSVSDGEVDAESGMVWNQVGSNHRWTDRRVGLVDREH